MSVPGTQFRETVEFVQRAEQAGAAWITVHGRTSKQRAEPASMDAIKLVGAPSPSHKKVTVIITLSIGQREC